MSVYWSWGKNKAPRKQSADAHARRRASASSALALGACACGGGCPRCRQQGKPLPAGVRTRAESVQGTNFTDVRVHTDAREATEPLKARAVTRGNDIYFHPGQFQPDSIEGRTLITHELAHTRQMRASATGEEPTTMSKPGDALERNADALARGATRHVLNAPAGIALRSPFDAESADDRARRERLLQAISNAVDTLLTLLRSGGLLQNTEVATERNGVRGVIYGAHTAGTADEEFVSYAERDARIRRIVRSLMVMGTLYRSAPIPADFSAPVRTETGEYQSTLTYPHGTTSYGGGTAEWADLQAAYERYRISQGQTGDAYESDWYYLDPSSRIVPGAARGAPRIGRGIPSGAYMVVPDIDHEPLRYWHLDGYSPIPRGSTIVEFWHDDFGYYYMHRGRRIDVPSPWSP